MSASGLEVRCPAKVNLSLRVGTRRPDGYHEIRTVFQAVDLWDSLRARPSERLTLVCDDPGVPSGPENLVLRAAEALRRAAGRAAGGAALRLRKRIPVAGGMGGGSSDAAGALVLLNRLWGLGLVGADLESLAAEIGSDVPFFLHGGVALGEGRGERLTDLPYPGDRLLLLGVPPFGVSTREAYDAFDRDLTRSSDDGSFPRSRSGNPPEENDFRVGPNDLEAGVVARRPELLEFREELGRSGAAAALLSGSGSTVFGVFDDSRALREAVACLGSRFARWRVFGSRTVACGVRFGGNDGAD